MQSWPPKDPEEVLDYQIKWANRLGTDMIQMSTWDVPTGLTKESDTLDNTITTIWLSGGTIGVTYVLTNHIETSGGRSMDQSVKLKIKEK